MSISNEPNTDSQTGSNTLLCSFTVLIRLLCTCPFTRTVSLLPPCHCCHVLDIVSPCRIPFLSLTMLFTHKCRFGFLLAHLCYPLHPPFLMCVLYPLLLICLLARILSCFSSMWTVDNETTFNFTKLYIYMMRYKWIYKYNEI